MKLFMALLAAAMTGIAIILFTVDRQTLTTLQFYGAEFAAPILASPLLGGKKGSGNRQAKLLVLGAGLSRTGTVSMKTALELMGYKVFHGGDLFTSGLSGTLYQDALTNEIAMDAFVDKLLEMGYNATLDLPLACLLPGLWKRFPDAKVLLTLRDSSEAWSKSFAPMRTDMSVLEVAPWHWLVNTHAIHMCTQQYLGAASGLTPCPAGSWLWFVPWYRPCVVDVWNALSDKEIYNRFNDNARKLLKSKPGNLLEFNVKMGWAPLEAFLGRKGPGGAFPNVNDGAAAQILGKILFGVCLIWPFMLHGVVTVYMYVVGKVFKVVWG